VCVCVCVPKFRVLECLRVQNHERVYSPGLVWFSLM
jgi:hypothetical protein